MSFFFQEVLAMLGFSSVLLGAVLLSATGDRGLPFGVPPMPEDATLARIAPEETLFYLSWAGVAAPDPKSVNQTEQLLAEPEVQNFLRQIDHAFRASMEKNMQHLSDEEKQMAAFGSECLRLFSTHPCAIFVSKSDGAKKALGDKDDAKGEEAEESEEESDSDNPLSEIMPLKEWADFEGGLVLSLGDDAKHFEATSEKLLEDVQRKLKESKPEKSSADGEEKAKEEPAKNDGDSAPDLKIENVTIDGLTWHRRKIDELPGHWLIWGFRKGYFILTVGKEDAAERLLKRIDGEPPRWYAAIKEQAPVERRTLVAYADVRKIRELIVEQLDPMVRSQATMVADAIGVSNVTAMVEVWGLDGDNFANKTFLALDGEPQGLLRLVSEKKLSIEDLASIPRDATSAMAFRLDPHEALETVLDAIAKTSPEAKEEFYKQLDVAEKLLGVDIRHGVIDALGDTWCVYSSPSEGNYATVVVPLKDTAAAKLAFGRLMEMLKQQLAGQEKPENESANPAEMDITNLKPSLDRFEFEGHEVFCLNCITVAPSWCFVDNHLVIGLLPQDIKAYLSRGNRHEPMDGQSQVARLLKGEHAPSFLMYWNPRSIFRFGYSWLLMCGPAMSNTMRQMDVKADLSMLPSLPAIDRHLGPTVATVRRTPQGIEFASRGTIPLPADAATFIGLCVLSQYETFFQSRMVTPPAQTSEPENVEEETWWPTSPRRLPPCEPANEEEKKSEEGRGEEKLHEGLVERCIKLEKKMEEGRGEEKGSE
jgi:hypothetical protein